MEPEAQQMNLEEAISSVVNTLPPVIRTYIEQKRYLQVVQVLMQKYSLRVDQGSVLEREIMLLLMGVENPDEFVASLKSDAHLEASVVDEIVQDVNDKIFVPLREAEEKGDAEQPPQKHTMPQVHTPVAASALETETPSAPTLPPTPPVAQPTPPTPPPSTALPPKMVMPQRPTPPHTVAPENLPGAMPEVHKPENPSPAAAPQVPPPAPAAPRPAPNTPITKGYAVDPYREPIDDEPGPIA